MLGAIIGDVVGSIYEFNNIKTKEFDLLSQHSTFTDDTVMTVAVAKALLRSKNEKKNFRETLIEEMKFFGEKYPNAGYGGMFSRWLVSESSQPYNSYGNGSAMRVSPCGLIAVELEEALSLAKVSAEVTHNHPEGIKGAQAVAGAIFLAKMGKSKEDIKEFIVSSFYDLDFSLDDIRSEYKFDETCQETVPQAIVAFLESVDFEDAIRNAISLGGDSDTLAAITGSIALAFYRGQLSWILSSYEIPNDKNRLYQTIRSKLPEEFIAIIDEFTNESTSRCSTYGRVGICSQIKHTADNIERNWFKLTPKPISLDNGTTIEERLKNISKAQLTHDLCSSKRFVEVLCDYKIGVSNYNDYIELLNHISKNTCFLYEASLDECLLYLTYLWRADYFSGGYGDFDYKHREEIRITKMRIINLLFAE